MINLKNDLSTNIGKILFIVSLFLIFLIMSLDINNTFIQVDEYYTISLLQYSFIDSIRFTSINVHPPLYYIILKIALKIINTLNIGHTIFFLKMVSVIPYFILLLVSSTKIKKDYNWLTAGLFSITILTMGALPSYYITLRMYSWGLLFLVLSFISLKDVIEKSDIKSWALLTIFTILGCYTHYFLILNSIILYLLLLLYIIFYKNKSPLKDGIIKSFSTSDIKKWFASAIIAIVSYIPWMPTAIWQIKVVKSDYWVQPLDLNELLRILSYFITNEKIDFIRIIGIIVLAIFIYFAIKSYLNYKNGNNNAPSNINLKENDYIYILIGMSIFLLTILISLILNVVYRPVLVARYLIPSIGVLWLSISILMSKIYDYKKLFAVLFILLMLFSSLGMYGIMTAEPLSSENIFKDLNKKGSVIIFNDPYEFIKYEHRLPKAKLYLIKQDYGIYDYFIKKYSNLNEIEMDEVDDVAINNLNHKKRVYISINPTLEVPKLNENLTQKKIYGFWNNNNTINKIKFKTT